MNRLTSNPSAENRAMEIGETRTIHDPKSGRTWTLTRTNRPYAYDLCDAYNRELPQHSPKAWFVDDSGNLHFGDIPEATRAHTQLLERRKESERARFVRYQLEAAE